MPGNPFYRSQAWRRLRATALRRDGYRCTTKGCGSAERLTVDHIVARPRDAQGVTPADVLGNLRTLCASCDASIKEGSDGRRRRGGVIQVRGCDAAGVPRDPDHPWYRHKG